MPQSASRSESRGRGVAKEEDEEQQQQQQQRTVMHMMEVLRSKQGWPRLCASRLVVRRAAAPRRASAFE